MHVVRRKDGGLEPDIDQVFHPCAQCVLFHVQCYCTVKRCTLDQTSLLSAYYNHNDNNDPSIGIGVSVSVWFVVCCTGITSILVMWRRKYSREALLRSTAATRVITIAPATSSAAAQTPDHLSDLPPNYIASGTGYQATGYQATGYQATGYEAADYRSKPRP